MAQQGRPEPHQHPVSNTGRVKSVRRTDPCDINSMPVTMPTRPCAIEDQADLDHNTAKVPSAPFPNIVSADAQIAYDHADWNDASEFLDGGLPFEEMHSGQNLENGGDDEEVLDFNRYLREMSADGTILPES